MTSIGLVNWVVDSIDRLSSHAMSHAPAAIDMQCPSRLHANSQSGHAKLGTKSLTYCDATCSCLPRLYHCIEILRTLSTTTEPELSVARTAVRTAHDAFKCDACTRSGTANSTEKLLALSYILTLLPGIYVQLLHVIDQETTLAEAENRGIAFLLEGSGCLWGDLAGENGCPEFEGLKDKPLKPEVWRQTMRALLKTDVYGGDVGRHCGKAEGSVGEGQHLGLKGMVTILDDLAKTGNFDRTNFSPQRAGETTRWMELIDNAKQRVNELVIF